MGQDELERALREMLSRQAGERRTPGVADHAGLAIRRANRGRRRRTFAGAALAAVATVLGSVGLGQFSGLAGGPAAPVVVLADPDVTAAPTPAAPRSAAAGGTVRAEVDLIIAGSLHARGGWRVDLAGLGPVDRAQRVAGTDSWLVAGARTVAGRTLWLVRRDTPPQVLLAGAESIVFAPDGRHVAWREGHQLATAMLVGNQLVAATRVAAPVRAAPAAFVGNAVLVKRDELEPGLTVWRPAAGPLTAGPDRRTTAVYGVLPDGRVVGQIVPDQGDRACLALLDPSRDLAPVRTDCELTLRADGRGGVSPDGRWLLVNGEKDGATGAYLVDLAALGRAVARPAGPELTGDVAWASPQAAVYVAGEGALKRFQVDRVLAGERATGDVAAVAPADRPVVVPGEVG
ncbi:hypothetical protein AB0H57_16335 [Micromonospora sp. NPDC050686]|uniref:hypothetical protein n=1 Tax=Micromonospora sp. NPDC050686 TaxID=3154631 RepID=UPI0033D37B8D